MPVVLGKSEPGARTKVGTTRDFQGFPENEIQDISELQRQASLKSAKPGLSCGSRASFSREQKCKLLKHMDRLFVGQKVEP
jgi:hypothetical protein